MNRWHFVRLIVLLVALLSCPVFALTGAYTVNAGADRLEFVPQPEKGYVIKLAEKAGGITALNGVSIPDGDNPKPVGGLDRHSVWTVENEGPASRNEDTICSLRAGGQVAYAAPLFSSNGETVAIIPEIVVRVKPGTGIEEVQSLSVRAGCTIRKRMEFTEQEYLLDVQGSDADRVFAAVEQLNQAPEVEWACPDTASRPKLCGQAFVDTGVSGERQRVLVAGQKANSAGVFPNDPYFPKQWHLHNTGRDGGTPGADIRAPEAWEITTGDPNIVVAVIGAGVDTHHPDLVNNLVPGYDFLDNDDTPDPGNSGGWEDAHDTMCAGVIAAQGNNGIGVAGVAYNCKIMPIRLWSATESVPGSGVATALRWAAAHGADVLSNSWTWGPTAVIISAVTDVTRPGGIGRDGKGCVVCFAAGNDGGPITEGSSATWPEVISVGATDHDDVRWPYSNYGPQLDLVAPSGCDGAWCGKMAIFWSTDQTGPGGYSDRNSDLTILDYGEYWGGTSVSCPIVAGVAALVLSVNPNLTNLEVGRILLCSAHDLGEPGWDEYYGFGRVDAYAAACMAFDPPLAELFVDDDGPNDPGPGDPTVSDPDEDGSAQHPFDAIQKAIDASTLPGRTVTVLPGTYTGLGNRDIDYAKRIVTVRSSAGPETCIIDCQNAGRAFFFHHREVESSAVEGLTITRGKNDEGGAILCSGGSSPTIKGCIFRANAASIDGGGIYCNGQLAPQEVTLDSKPAIRNCTFMQNSAGRNGGAICCGVISDPTIADCVFRGNSARSKGGGTYACEGSSLTVRGSRFENNAASLPGGAMSNVGGDCTVTSCLFAGNSAPGGAGICCEGGRCALTNCTFADNTSLFMAGGVWIMSGATTVANCILWGNKPSQIIGPAVVSFSDVQVGWPQAVPGNIAADPLFADPANADYHLKSKAGRWDPVTETWVKDDATSPCIDAGDPTISVGDEPEPNGGRVNMGAYGGTKEASKSYSSKP